MLQGKSSLDRKGVAEALREQEQKQAELREWHEQRLRAKVRQARRWPRSWANSSLL
jgi:hypothetical protein